MSSEDMRVHAPNLHLENDGIWYGSGVEPVSYPDDGYEHFFALEDNSFWFRHRNRCVVSLVRGFPPEGTIFDVGGGNGFVSQGLTSAGFKSAVVEPGADGARNAKRRGLENVICATTDAAGFENDTLPAVGLFDVVEHIENDVAFLQSMKRLVVPGGRFYLTVPAYSFLWSSEDVLAGHYRRYSLPQIIRVVETAGLTVDFATYIFRVLPLPIFLLRSLPFRLGFTRREINQERAQREHGASGSLLNRLVEFTLGSEVKNIESQTPMRFGGSCLIAARKP